MPVLTDAELRMVAEVVSELAKLRGSSFDKAAMGFTFARAALIDPAFRARLGQVHHLLAARLSRAAPERRLASIAPSLRDLELDADAVVSGWREPDPEAD